MDLENNKLKDETNKVEENEKGDVSAQISVKFLGVILLAESPLFIWGIIAILKLNNDAPFGVLFSVIAVALIIVNGVILYLTTPKNIAYKKSALQISTGIDMVVLLILFFGVFR